jgi:3-deoxy-D-manno-octulosonic-acid transferase
MVLWLIQPLMRARLKRRGVKESGYLLAVEERFGHYASEPLALERLTVWLHAVSLGETRAAAVLVARLRERLPGMRLLLTHGTATGREEGVRLLQPGDLQTWQPWDTPYAVRRFLEHFKPSIGVLMETEIWPNLAQECQRAQVPLVLANARMSEKSLGKAKRLSWLSRPAYGALAAVWAQTEADAQRLRQLGAQVSGVMGNLKFDAIPNVQQVAKGREWRNRTGRPVVMLASSREGEEEQLLDAIDSEAIAVQWLIVPRHPQRFAAVAALVESHGFAVSRRSAWGHAPAGGDATRPTVWLGDSLGEMGLYYGLADVALLGGSFEPLGGQNLIEAAACGCPVVMGPSTFNFAEAATFAQEMGAAKRVENMSAGVTLAVELACDPALLKKAQAASNVFANSNRGATERLTAAIAQMLVAGTAK